MKENLQYNVIFKAEPEGGFTATVPALPGCISFGKDLTEAKIMIADAIGGYVASLQKHGEPVPSDTESFMATVLFPALPNLQHA